MNYEKIENEYREAYKLFSKEAKKSWTNDRDLYDFFDKQETYLEVGMYAYGKNDIRFEVLICDNKPNWIFIKNKNGESKYFTTRTEAEEAGFMKCFEILENKIERENNEIKKI